MSWFMTQRISLQSSYNSEIFLSKEPYIRLKQFSFPELFIVGSNFPLKDQTTEMLDPVRVI